MQKRFNGRAKGTLGRAVKGNPLTEINAGRIEKMLIHGTFSNSTSCVGISENLYIYTWAPPHYK